MDPERKIIVFAINLKNRKDRKDNLIQEFNNRQEFELRIIPAIEDERGSYGLWKTIKSIVSKAKEEELDLFILCEDDHSFTSFYSKDSFFEQLEHSISLRADILMGGVSWFEMGLQIKKNIFWLNKFNGLQFTVIFNCLYNKILNATFNEFDVADLKLSTLCENKFVVYPFISIQKEFGYSDVTKSNNIIGHVEQLFIKCSTDFELLSKVNDHFEVKKASVLTNSELENIIITTYVIIQKQANGYLQHIREQFENKSEFELRIIKGNKHSIKAVGLWKSLVKIVKMAIENDEDVIIICDEDHCFTENYDKNDFLNNVLDAHNQGTTIISGGIEYFKQSVPITANRYWIDYFYGTHFTVIFRPLFDKILEEPFNDYQTLDEVLSELSSNKMVLYPFISVLRNFDYVGIIKKPHPEKNRFMQSFKKASNYLSTLEKTYKKFLK